MLTSLNFLNTGKAWPPDSESERLQTYEQNKKLFLGKHEQVFKNWVKLLRSDQKATLELILNWNKRLSLLWADLLLGEPPEITAGDPESPEQEALETIIKLNSLMLAAYEVAIDVSRFGHGIFKIRFDKYGIIEAQPPTYWFPVVQPDNVKNFIYHVFAWTYEEEIAVAAGLGVRKQKYLKVEIHEKGKITYRLYKMNGERVGTLVDEKIQETGVSEFLVVPVNNVSTSDMTMGIDDYSDLDGIIQELEMRVAQISKILDKHADPNMYGPAGALTEDPVTGEVSLRGGGKFFELEEGENPPGYVTWEGQLESAFKQVDTLMTQLYFLSETSAAAFGELKAGLAESGSALKRLMAAPLAKAARIRARFDPALRKALEIASILEVSQHMPKAAKLENIHIEWNDGLPQDENEATTLEVQRYSAGLASIESSLKRLYGLKGKALNDEIAKIKKETEAKKPEPPVVKMPETEPKPELNPDGTPKKPEGAGVEE